MSALETWRQVVSDWCFLTTDATLYCAQSQTMPVPKDKMLTAPEGSQMAWRKSTAFDESAARLMEAHRKRPYRTLGTRTPNKFD